MPKAEVFLPILGFVRTQIIINCVIVFLVLVVVSLRVAGRLMGPGLGWDDGLIVFATPLGVAMLICQGFFAPIGNGYPLAQHPELVPNIPFILQLTFGMTLVYIVLLAAVKASMLCFFLRVFVTTTVQRLAKVTLAFVAMWMLSYVGASIFLCNPVSAQWTGQGTCGAYIPLIQSLIATNAIGDLIIMILPMYSIWNLNMRKTDKVGITASFGLGIACMVCAVFRLVHISTVDMNANITGTMPTTVFLFILEPNLAILCVSIPMLRPFYVLYRKYVGGSKLQDSDDRPSRFRDYASQEATGKSALSQSGDPTAWEMDKYYPPSKGSHQNNVSTAVGDESGSEENLTYPGTQSRRVKDEILVQKKWTVSRD